MPEQPEVEVVSGDLPCHRCGGPLLLALRVPHRIQTQDGREITGWRAVELCPRCDRDNRAAQGVLAYFAVEERITGTTVDQAVPVLREWIDHVLENPPSYSDAELDEDIRRWESGDM